MAGRIYNAGGYSTDHGTQIAGLICAIANNSIGVAGIAPETIVVNRAAASNDEADLAEAIVATVAEDGADVVNLSFGQHQYSGFCGYPIISQFCNAGTLFYAIDNAYRRNVAVVVSGKDHGEPDYAIHVPSDFRVPISVTYHDRLGNLDGDASASTSTDLSAPGVLVNTTSPNGTYSRVSGTSFAAPFVAGAAALLLARDPTLSAEDIDGILKASAQESLFDTQPGRDDDWGWGMLDVGAAVERLDMEFMRASASGNVTSYAEEPASGAARLFLQPPPSKNKGWYRAQLFRVELNVTFPTPFVQPPAVWGRKSTLGYDTFGVQTGVGACDAVPGSATNTSVRMRTYVYKVRGLIDNVDAGWFPCAPEEVRFDYTANGVEDHYSPTALVVALNGGESVQAGGSTSIEWHVADEYLPGVRCDILLDLVIGGGTSVWMVAAGQTVDGNGNGFYNWSIPGGLPGGSTYKIRVIASDTNGHQGVDASDTYFTIQPWSGKGGPPPPPEPCTMPCAPPSQTTTYVTDLLPATPNPFNPQTRLQFTLKSADDVTLRIYDIHGRLVTTVIDGQQSPGLHEALWDGRDADGRQVVSGVYFAALNANQRVFTRKLVMLK